MQHAGHFHNGHAMEGGSRLGLGNTVGASSNAAAVVSQRRKDGKHPLTSPEGNATTKWGL